MREENRCQRMAECPCKRLLPEIPEETRRVVEPLLPAEGVYWLVGNEIDQNIRDDDIVDVGAHRQSQVGRHCWHDGTCQPARNQHLCSNRC